MKVVIECGQSVWRYHSWIPYKYSCGRNWSRTFRRLPGSARGFAVGPVIFLIGKD